MEIKQDKENRLTICESCGGSLMQKDPYVFQCSSCGRKYYISADRTHKVSIRLSAGKIILICAALVILVTALAVTGYQFYTGRMVASASRFSVVFRDFLMEVYQKPAAEIHKEDLEKIKYLRIEENKGYQFTYGFEDYYTYDDPDTALEEERTVSLYKIDLRTKEITEVYSFTGRNASVSFSLMALNRSLFFRQVTAEEDGVYKEYLMRYDMDTGKTEAVLEEAITA